MYTRRQHSVHNRAQQVDFNHRTDNTMKPFYVQKLKWTDHVTQPLYYKLFYACGSQFLWFFLVKRVPGRGPEQRESEKTVLYLQITIMLISYIITC